MIPLLSRGVIPACRYGLGKSSDHHSRSASNLLAAILNQKRPLGSRAREPLRNFSMASDEGIYKWPFSSIGARTRSECGRFQLHWLCSKSPERWNDGDRPPAKNGQMHAVMETRPEDKIDFRTRAWNRKPAILAIGARGVLRPRSLASPRSRRPKPTTSETCSRRGPESLRVIETSLRAKMKRRYTS